MALFISVNALPVSGNKLPRFDIKNPEVNSEWLVDSLVTVSWGTSSIPTGSTMDIALLQHEKKRSILLRRYIPAQQGSTNINLGPQIEPGVYSLLLTVYKGRTSTAIARSLVSSLVVVDEVQNGVKPKDIVALAQANKVVVADSFHFKKDFKDAILDDEPVQLINQSGGNALVLMAPYTIGWTIPKALKHVSSARVNILLVSRDSDLESSVKTVRVLHTNVDARASFQLVFLPKDTPLKQRYQIRIEIYGNGRKFVGYTHQFYTTLPAFAKKP
ncbi:hypothetical protein BGZ46_006998 [Entomortierella lignicola]|nr:hypothetical protein BGZ46_006998 [Entomortierella lignicola]